MVGDGKEPKIYVFKFKRRKNYRRKTGTGRSSPRSASPISSWAEERMAHKKGVGSSRNGRTSNPQYLGVKRYGGETGHRGQHPGAAAGHPFHPGKNVRRANDDTLFALVDGVVRFEFKDKNRQKVSVYPVDRAAAS